MTGSDEFTEDTPPPKQGSVPPVVPEPFNERMYRERARAFLAVGLGLLLAVVLIAVTVRSLWLMANTKDATDLLGVVIAPLVGLVGAATGFYYGGKVK